MDQNENSSATEHLLTTLQKKKQYLEKIAKYKRKMENINDDIQKYKRKRDHVNEDIIKYNKKIADIDQIILNEQIQLIHSQVTVPIETYTQKTSIAPCTQSITKPPNDVKQSLVTVVPSSSSDYSSTDSDTESTSENENLNISSKTNIIPTTTTTTTSITNTPKLSSTNPTSNASVPLLSSSTATSTPYKLNITEGSLGKFWITNISGCSNLTQPLRCLTQFRNINQKVLVAGTNTGTLEVYDLDMTNGLVKYRTNYIINSDSNAFVDDVDLDSTEQYCIATLRAKQGLTAKSSFIMVDVKDSKVILQPLIEAHRKPMVTCKFLSKGMNFVSVSKDNSFLWVRDIDQSLASGCSFLPTPISSKNLSDVYNPINSDYLYLLSADAGIESFSLKEKRQAFIIDNVNRNLRTTGFATMINPSSNNQNTLLYGYTNLKSHTQSVDIFDIKTQRVVYSAQSSEDKLSEYIVPSWHPNGNIISCGSASGMIYFFDIRINKSNLAVGKYKLKSRVNRANFYPDPNYNFIYTLCSSHPRLSVLTYKV